MTERIDSISPVRRTSQAEDLADFAHTEKNNSSQPDKVALSLTAQARLLKDRGASVEEIASELGLTVAIVMGDLGISHNATKSELITK